MLQKILQSIIKEDTFKLFTGTSGPSILDEFKGMKEPVTVQECRQVIFNFFGRIVAGSDPSAFYSTEARRMQQVIEGIFAEIEREYVNGAQQAAPRGINDEIVDIYMESLQYFISELDIPILKEHVSYLER
ncbi:hypothetical protein PAEPH01_0831 [Pancytospora epiphaga]|nr:hypothetical protein PAEPH01_0831 [Pancytospora epiphaga]